MLRKSLQTRRPARLPNRLRAASSTSAAVSSLPPPLPKIPPTSAPVAITSVAFQSSGPSGRPIAPYSPGILVGSSRASAM
jgi:hypothetical protein